MRRLVDLSQRIRFGQVTHPGLPAPAWEAFRGPFHRFGSGDDLAALPLQAVVDLPIRVVDVWGRRAVDADILERRVGGDRIADSAVLLYTGGDADFGTAAYAHEAPYLTADGAAWLAERDPALVGIDAVNVDDLDDLSRPAHTVLLGRGVLVLEHLTGLANVPARGARLHAAPPAWHGVGTWPVRAYAVIEEDVT